MILHRSVKPLMFGLLFAAPSLASAAPAQKSAPKAASGETVFAEAKLAPGPNQKASGTVSFAKRDADLKVRINLKDVSPGEHGIHIHEKGACTAPDFKSAGGHYNPVAKEHGAPNVKTSHAGDLGNIVVKADGTATTTVDLSAKVYGTQDWNDLVGRAVVLHAKKDDLKTQPAGDSGDRIACGVIEKAGMAQK